MVGLAYKTCSCCCAAVNESMIYLTKNHFERGKGRRKCEVQLDSKIILWLILKPYKFPKLFGGMLENDTLLRIQSEEKESKFLYTYSVTFSLYELDNLSLHLENCDSLLWYLQTSSV